MESFDSNVHTSITTCDVNDQKTMCMYDSPSVVETNQCCNNIDGNLEDHINDNETLEGDLYKDEQSHGFNGENEEVNLKGDHNSDEQSHGFDGGSEEETLEGDHYSDVQSHGDNGEETLEGDHYSDEQSHGFNGDNEEGTLEGDHNSDKQSHGVDGGNEEDDDGDCSDDNDDYDSDDDYSDVYDDAIKSDQSKVNSSGEDNNYSDDDSYDQNKVFKKTYRVYPFSYVDKAHLEGGGNRIILPVNDLEELMDLQVEFPMFFKIENLEKGKTMHCGVLEFSVAEIGVVMMPSLMMKNLCLDEGETVNLESVCLAPASYIKFQPHRKDFFDVRSFTDVLEGALQLGYACLTVGETILINHEGKDWFFDIVDAKPSEAVSVVEIETDVSIDFAPALDYKEPEIKKAVVSKTEVKELADELQKFVPFTGKARRLNQSDDNSEETKTAVKETTTAIHDAVNVCCNNDKMITEATPSSLRTFIPFTGKKYTLNNCNE